MRWHTACLSIFAGPASFLGVAGCAVGAQNVPSELGARADQTAVTDKVFNDMFGSWSPNGQEIAFTSDRSGDPEIYVANATGSNLQQLTYSPGRDAHPSWTQDGRVLLFQSPRQGGEVRIFQMRRDGATQRALVLTKGFCGVPSPSPDGSSVAFQCSGDLKQFGTAQYPWRIFLLRFGNRLPPRPITEGPGNDQVPNWSPDGRRLLFYSDRSGSNQIYELELATGNVRQLTFGPVAHSAASYASDGKRVALMRAAPGEKADVYVFTPPSIFHRITTTGPEFGGPQFSPNGHKLLFQMPTPDGVRLFIALADGTGRPLRIDFR